MQPVYELASVEESVEANEPQPMGVMLDEPTKSGLGKALKSGQRTGQESVPAAPQPRMQLPEPVDSNKVMHQLKIGLSNGSSTESSSKSGVESGPEDNGPEKPPSYPHTYSPQCLPGLGDHFEDQDLDGSRYDSGPESTQEEESGTSCGEEEDTLHDPQDVEYDWGASLANDQW